MDTAKVWIGLKDNDDIGLRLDLRTEVLVNGTVAATGDLNDIAAGSSGFNNAKLHTIPLTPVVGVSFAPTTSEPKGIGNQYLRGQRQELRQGEALVQ